jgi:ABC-type uncharacterized transport system auxiliary subunit
MKNVRQRGGCKALALLALLALFASCQNEAQWYPTADVSIQARTEYRDAEGPKLAVTLVIHNSGKTSIRSSTVTVKVNTSKREYLQTAAFENKIIPDGKVAVTMTVAYLEADETVQPDGVSVYNAYFD